MVEEEKVVLEIAGVKHKKQQGTLLLTSLRVAWAPGEIVQTFEADYPYQQIKAQRISAETSSRVQLQLVLQSGAHINFHFAGPNAIEQRQKVKEHLARALSKASPLHISAELEAKNSLLKNNPSLYQLYRDLVTTGLITADEFWASHTLDHMRGDSADAAQRQEGGLPSAFLADVQAVYDGCNAVKYNLSTDVIHAIFKTYPMVRKKHAEMVPQKLKEEQFWTQFFQSQYFHQDSKNEQFVDCLSGGQRQGVGRVHPIHIPESTSELLGEEGYSVTSHCSVSTSSSLLKRCNHHSNRVLEALMDGTSIPESCATSPTPPPPPVHLKRLQGTDSITLSSELLVDVAHDLCSWQLQQGVAAHIAHAAVPYLAPGGSLMARGYGQKGSSVLTVEQQQQVFRHQAAIAELLRHFWSCFPARTAQLEVKAHKMHQCVVEYREKQLRELEQALDSTDTLHIVQHLHECIERATQHYHKWTAKKKIAHR